MGYWRLDRKLESCPVSLRLGPGSLVISLDPVLTVATDLEGRPWRVVDRDTTYRWALSGRALELRRDGGGKRLVRGLGRDEAGRLWRGVRQRLSGVLKAPHDWEPGELSLVAGSGEGETTLEPSLRFLLEAVQRVAGWDEAALNRDAEEFSRVYSPVGVLPPDLYQALVVQMTLGCSFNRCTFCGLYRQVRFQIRSPGELADHMTAVDRFLGRGGSLRRNIFLGDANALTLPMERLEELLAVVSQHHAGRLGRGQGIYSFLDAFSGSRKAKEHFRRLRRLGLRGICVGMESGHDPLLAWLKKPGTSEDVQRTIESIKEAELQVSVVVLLGAGGREFDAGHVEDTASLLASLPLKRSDIVYFSDLVPDSASPYQELSARDGIEPLGAEERGRQRETLAEALAPVRDGGPRRAVYDIREFTY